MLLASPPNSNHMELISVLSAIPLGLLICCSLCLDHLYSLLIWLTPACSTDFHIDTSFALLPQICPTPN